MAAKVGWSSRLFGTKQTHGVFVGRGDDMQLVYRGTQAGANAEASKLRKQGQEGVTVGKLQTENPLPKGKWLSATAVKVNRNGTVSVKMNEATIKRATKNSRKRNVQGGFTDATGFHPFRSSSDYDPDRAGDDYGARSDNKGFVRRRKTTAKKAARQLHRSIEQRLIPRRKRR